MNEPVLSTKAYSYVRFSTPPQALGHSLQRQAEKAAKYAVEHGLTLDTELNMTDAGVSAFRGKNATTGALGGFMSAVESGYVSPGSYLLIENIDRLSRDHVLEASTLFSRLLLAGIIIVTLTNGEAYSRQRLNDEPHAMIMIVLEQIRANQENVRKSQLIGDAKARKKQQLVVNGLNGKPYTRQTPAWIKWSDESKTYELLPDRAAIVREIFERTDAGDGIDRIAKDLNQRGVNTWGGSRGQRKANHWRISYMRKILMSSAPIGSFTPHTTEHDEITRARRDKACKRSSNIKAGCFRKLWRYSNSRIKANSLSPGSCVFRSCSGLGSCWRRTGIQPPPDRCDNHPHREHHHGSFSLEEDVVNHTDNHYPVRKQGVGSQSELRSESERRPHPSL